ncbi:hypothetical protein L202_04069 [Cryptococcus amylolentus CBS 6039]|uniref:GCF C-terminal domain-containing protein n=1 Tax=Cryptococcus amylolentus CBS 6039 TaxID=1295533 RepID=A0A1E3HSK3_9TREE|nr:hypothetical protein L202_04069 [Cryptococcus amylolentus CBS 6039]ODN78431.1 hypothetical protein L202_04069 [Cryptococcus amylolentus CBS 6039]
MFIKRAKPRPSLRARESDAPDSPATSSSLAKSSITAGDAQDPDTSADIDLEEGSGSLLGRKKAGRKDKTKDRLKKGGRLSFGGEGEDEEEAFKPKKSLLSQQIKLPPTPGGDSYAAPAPSASGSSYSQEYLSQLKAATPTRAPRSATDSAGDDEEIDASGLSRLARQKYGSSIAQDTTAGIPDAATIAAAKMKRQAGLGNGQRSSNRDGGEDYISLSEGGGGGRIAIYDGQQGPHPESRLMREEDETGDGDEDMAEFTEAKDRLYLGKDAKKAAARRLRGEIGDLIADREADIEDDEEALEWEKAQVQRSGMHEDERSEKTLRKGYTPAPIPVARPPPTILSASSRLTKAMGDIQISKTESDRNLDIVIQELAELEGQEKDLRVAVEKAEDKKEWMEEFRGWVEMLGAFLEEKFPKLESIENDAVHHIKERSDIVRKRHEEDDGDDLSLFLGVPRPAAGEEEVDELGRVKDINREAGPSSGVRRGRREERGARRLRRQRQNRGPASVDEDGFSTDSTLADADIQDYTAALNKLDHRVHALMHDVKAEDFKDPNKGLAVKFGGWRQRDEEEYSSAFGGLALVQAWEFWARAEMVGWEPLRGSTSLESFGWFGSLYRYCHPPVQHADEDDDMDDAPLSCDGDLVASMVSSAVVPLLTKTFEAGAYDPYSAPQTRRAVDLADVVAELTGKDSRKFTALLKAVLTVFHEHLISLSTSIAQATAFDAIQPPAFDPATRTEMERYVRRRIKLLKNILLWKREAPQEVRELVVRLVGEVLRPILSRHWDGGGKEMGLKVLPIAEASLPPDLVQFLQQGPNDRWQ